MLNLSLAGNLGRDAEYKQTQGGNELCSFAVAVNTGFGDNKTTVWIDVTKWGKGAKGLSDILVKGSKVAVSGELSTREHNGKTYLQCRANDVTIMGTPGGSQSRGNQSSAGGGGWGSGQADSGSQGGGYDDLGSDSIPF
ncbi:single-stranded DNA-binding protein [Croceicoccus sp. YJ47]|uniref:single-stranded DNA-binding protein n=1 Tax=Croceicoccus sp. YJ47 TaxID=2798724 RepID=UPI0019226744|nr:single-stranded DNA-binding protein [Croceicoccus sp. YJ47]QQN73913.1 single-stranded DNA-binding protein [Croceicoccus sp. YJ47]